MRWVWLVGVVSAAIVGLVACSPGASPAAPQDPGNDPVPESAGAGVVPGPASAPRAAAAAETAGTPRAVMPEDEVDFGDVPVVMDMSQALQKEFLIRNEGTADLRLLGAEVKTLEGC